MKVAIFPSCIVDTIFPEAGAAAIRLLERLGVDVDFPLEQTCCGQMHLNTGYETRARKLAAKHLSSFSQYDWVIGISTSCTTTVREFYPQLLGATSAEVGGSGKFLELSEFLLDVLGVTELEGTFAKKVTFHTSCHSLRGIHLGDRPQRLLSMLEGIELIPLPKSDSCCGFGGTFSIKNSAISTVMMEEKLANVYWTGAEVLTAADSSCLMNLSGGIQAAKKQLTVMHYAEILEIATRQSQKKLLNHSGGR
ncbi:MAG: (Fe-S)-binding protein [Acidimicrobiaceae bacterium]|nr:(Fe-S)-binding protein [Acidimicrobiaceae bacterium]